MRQGDLFEPSLPYAGTSGAVGVATSQERAAENDKPGGKTSKHQATALDLLERAGVFGLTVVELRSHALFTGHHGDASSALTNLHMDERIVRLSERRDRAHVYVLPEHRQLRPTMPYESQRKVIGISDKGARRAAVEYIREKRRSGDPDAMALAQFLRSALEAPH